MATKLQKRAFEIMRANPSMSPANALIMAGYSDKSVLGSKTDLLNSKGIASLSSLYQFELVKQGMRPKKIAKLAVEGAKSVDLKTRLPYLESIKKDLGISEQAPDTLIQVNLAPDIDKIAT